MVSVLTRIFGTEHLELAEDVVQDTFISAMGAWKLKGVPDNPSAWLFRAARNKALDIIRKELDVSLALTGNTDVRYVNNSVLHRSAP